MIYLKCKEKLKFNCIWTWSNLRHKRSLHDLCLMISSLFYPFNSIFQTLTHWTPLKSEQVEWLTLDLFFKTFPLWAWLRMPFSSMSLIIYRLRFVTEYVTCRTNLQHYIGVCHLLSMSICMLYVAKFFSSQCCSFKCFSKSSQIEMHQSFKWVNSSQMP